MAAEDLLRGGYAKVERAEKHMAELQERFHEFLDSKPYTLEPVIDEKESVYVELPAVEVIARGLAAEPSFMWKDKETGLVRLLKRCRVTFRVRLEREFPSLDFGVIMGDIVHDLRSALDNVVWALSVAHSGPAPTPVSGKWRFISFPTILDADDWAKKGLSSLWAVDPVLYPAFESMQPFGIWQGGGGEPHTDPFYVLNELWIGDKHRAATIAADAIDVVPLPTPGFSFSDIHRPGPGRYEDGASLLSFTATNTLMSVNQAKTADFPGRASFDMAFEAGPPMFGDRVDKYVGLTSGLVRVVLGEFKNFLSKGTLPDFSDQQRMDRHMLGSPFVRDRAIARIRAAG